jgi:hypothetical protein
MYASLYSSTPASYPAGMRLGLGESFWGETAPAPNTSGFWANPQTAAAIDIDPQQAAGIERYNVAKSLVSLDYCKQLACGAIQQSEAGPTNVAACGLVYPLQPQAWCSEFCSPYRDVLKARYGSGICGGEPAPPPAPVQPFLPALPEMIQPVTVPQEALPQVLRPTSVAFLDEVSCPSCEADCVIKIGGCCLTQAQALALAGLFLLAVVS